jgi:hypothetical protein
MAGTTPRYHLSQVSIGLEKLNRFKRLGLRLLLATAVEPSCSRAVHVGAVIKTGDPTGDDDDAATGSGHPFQIDPAACRRTARIRVETDPRKRSAAAFPPLIFIRTQNIK